MRHLLTGAGSGIGASLAARLLARGDELVLVARSHERAQQLASAYAGATTVVADLADPASLADLELPGELDSVVHAAGVVDLGTVAELTAAQWRDQLEVNLLAPAELTRLALPSLRATSGTVVFVNSGAGLRANPEWGAYAASKFGLRALADALRAEEKAGRRAGDHRLPGAHGHPDAGEGARPGGSPLRRRGVDPPRDGGRRRPARARPAPRRHDPRPHGQPRPLATLHRGRKTPMSLSVPRCLMW